MPLGVGGGMLSHVYVLTCMPKFVMYLHDNGDRCHCCVLWPADTLQSVNVNQQIATQLVEHFAVYDMHISENPLQEFTSICTCKRASFSLSF